MTRSGSERERSRDRILAAALAEFAARGFDGTTTAGVARRAEVTQPLVHYHFATKDQLWRAAVATVLDELEAAFAGTLPELSDLEPLDRLKVLVRRFVRFCAHRPEFGRILSYEGVAGGARLDWLLEQPPATALATFNDLLEQGVTDGWAKPLPMAHVATCLGAAAAYAFIAREIMAQVYGIDVTDPAAVDTHADTVIELFFHGLVVPDAAPRTSGAPGTTDAEPRTAGTTGGADAGGDVDEADRTVRVVAATATSADGTAGRPARRTDGGTGEVRSA